MTILVLDLKLILLKGGCKKKNGHTQMQIWRWPLATNLETLFYDVSLHAPDCKHKLRHNELQFMCEWSWRARLNEVLCLRDVKTKENDTRETI